MKIPEKIYLQRYDEEDNPMNIDDWTWHRKQVFKTDLEYILDKEVFEVLEYYADARNWEFLNNVPSPTTQVASRLLRKLKEGVENYQNTGNVPKEEEEK